MSRPSEIVPTNFATVIGHAMVKTTGVVAFCTWELAAECWVIMMRGRREMVMLTEDVQ